MFLYNNVYYSNDSCKMAISVVPGTKIVEFHENTICIGPGFAKNNKEIEKVICPSHLKEIKNNAFYSCDSLKEISFNDSLEKIGNAAFIGCSFEKLAFPASLKVIKKEAFCSCHLLKEVEFSENITRIEPFTFSSTGIENLVLPRNLESIEESAFEFCESLKSITIPASVFAIEPGAFLGCSEVENIKIDKENVHYGTRKNCNAIVDIAENEIIFGNKNTTILPHIKSIGAKAFAGTDIKEVILPDSVEVLNSQCFAFSSLKKITFSENLEKLRTGVFCDCVMLKEVNFNDSLKDLGVETFSGCEELRHIEIPDSIDFIGFDCFRNCVNLEKVKWPAKYNEVNQRVFSFCEKLKEINLENVKFINHKAFEYCKELDNISLNSIEAIREKAFERCTSLNNIDIKYHNNLVISSNAFDYTAIFTKQIQEKEYFDIADVLIRIGNIENFVVPSHIKVIAYSAAYGNNNLKSIFISKGVKTIGKEAFRTSTLEQVVFSEGLREICDSAFENTYLKSIKLPHSLKKLGHHAFASCSQLQHVDDFNFKNISFGGFIFEDTAISDISFLKNVDIIPSSMFESCSNLKDVIIPENIKVIEDFAFDESSVKNIILNNNIEAIELLGNLPNIEHIFCTSRHNLSLIFDEEDLTKYGSIISEDILDELIKRKTLKEINNIYKSKQNIDKSL